MERSEKAKKLRELRKFGKKVSTFLQSVSLFDSLLVCDTKEIFRNLNFCSGLGSSRSATKETKGEERNDGCSETVQKR